MGYRDYLKSDHWQRIRRSKANGSGRKCEHCGSSKRIQVHHLSYAYQGREKGRHLMVLCDRCHLAIEAWIYATKNRPKGSFKGLKNFTHNRLVEMGIVNESSCLSHKALQMIYDFQNRN